MDKWERLEQRRGPIVARAAPQPRLQHDTEPKKRGEVWRVIGLPTHKGREWDENTVRKREGLTLRPIQRQALASIADAGGGVLPIGVGHGKTYISLLAGAALDASLVILLVPPRTVPQTYAALAQIDSHFTIPQVHVVSYSKLSLSHSSDLLTTLVKDHAPARVVLVADEAHNLKNFGAARTKRVARFLREHAGVRFVAMSGTLTSKSIIDFAHLSEWALGEGSPVPRPSTAGANAALEHWAAGVDVESQPSHDDWLWCEPLWQWAGNQPANLLTVDIDDRKRGLRQALYSRMATTKGVTMTDQSSFGASLYIDLQEQELPEELREVMDKVRLTKCRPDGEPLESPVEQWRVLRQLSLGFYYRWVWPNGIIDHEWLEARSEWARNVREQLDNHATEGYDSPLLVFNRIAKEYAAGKRRAIHCAWYSWSLVKDRPVPPTEAVWVTDEVLDTSFASVQSGPPTLVWYSDEAVADSLEQRGMLVVRAGKPVPTKVQTCAVSVKSHGTGLNLQGWAHNLVLSPMSSGKDWEQLIGRTHRPGQQQDEVWVGVLHHTLAFREAMAKAKANAEYLQHITGQPQKLLLASFMES